MKHKKSKTPAPFVELEAGNYLLEMLMEAGPFGSGDMGNRALTWPDITAYLTGYPCEVEHYERALLIKMSAAFVAGMDEGTSPFSIPPADRKPAK